MSRKRLFLAAFLAASTLILSTAEAQVRVGPGARRSSVRAYTTRSYGTLGYAPRAYGTLGYAPRAYGTLGYAPRAYGTGSYRYAPRGYGYAPRRYGTRSYGGVSIYGFRIGGY